MPNNNVYTVAGTIHTAYALRDCTWRTAHEYANTARALIAFCDKRDLTLYAVYVSHEHTLRAVVIRSDGMARRAFVDWYWRYDTNARPIGCKSYKHPAWQPLCDMRINRFHVTI